VPKGVRVQVPSSPHFTLINVSENNLKDDTLKIKTQPRDDHQVTLIVELDSVQMEGAKHRAARKISERKSIPGFRPGKAPYEVIVRNFGESVISDEAVDLLLDEVYPKALEEAKLEPAAAGTLEKVEDLDKKPKFQFIVPLAPVTELGDYRSIRLAYEWKEPGEEKTDESIDELRRMYAKTESVNRPIELGDFVMVDLKGFKSKAGNEELPMIDRPGLPVFVRDGDKEEEYPFKGFSKELVGLSAEEGKSFKHKFEKSHKDETLRGMNVMFSVKVNIVRGSIIPEINDEFAKQVGPFESMQALREAIKANLATQSKIEYDDEYFNNLIEKIKEKAVIKYPPQMLDHEMEHVLEDLKSRLSEQGLDMTAYLKSREMDEEKFMTEEGQPIARKRLERSLIMDQLAKVENIEVSRENLQASFEQTWGEYQGDPTVKKAMRGKAKPPKQLMNSVAMESANRAFVQQTLNRLKDIASGTATEIPSNDDMKKTVKKKSSKTTSPKSIKPENEKIRSKKKVTSTTDLAKQTREVDKKENIASEISSKSKKKISPTE
jgi:trigger factor